MIMRPARLIPCLLLSQRALVKTISFKKPNYIGDPLNAIKIFSDKGADEIVFLDILATEKGQRPQFDLLADIASECFIPFAYGGGLKTIADLKDLFSLGAEKAIINSQAVRSPDFIKQAAQIFGRQSVMVSMDVKKNLFGRERVYICRGRESTRYHPVDFVRKMERLGAGEILLNSIDRDGTWQGYDLALIKTIAAEVSIPVIAAGGAGNLTDCLQAIRMGASAAAAGSLFVYKAKGQGVLINFPKRKILDDLFTFQQS